MTPANIRTLPKVWRYRWAEEDLKGCRRWLFWPDQKKPETFYAYYEFPNITRPAVMLHMTCEHTLADVREADRRQRERVLFAAAALKRRGYSLVVPTPARQEGTA